MKETDVLGRKAAQVDDDLLEPPGGVEADRERGMLGRSRFLDATRALWKTLWMMLPREFRTGRAIALAQARTATERARQLVYLGVAFRHGRDHEASLRALDAAVQLEPGQGAERAAYACAVAVHRDRGDYETARKVVGSARGSVTI